MKLKQQKVGGNIKANARHREKKRYGGHKGGVCGRG
jgi:hypothetical protein